MAEDFLARAARFLKGISEYGESAIIESALRQVPLLVGGLSQTDHDAGVPRQNSSRQGK
jgi:hypothetical protein